MFVGLLSTKSDMIATAQKYLDEQNMFDLRLISSYGWSKEDVEKISQMTGIVDAEGSLTLDAFAKLGGTDDASVYRLHNIPKSVNQVYLLEGRMPEAPNECLLDGYHVEKSVLGSQLVIASDNEEETLDGLAEHTFTVVGLINSPLYMDMSRGNTTLGNGSLTGFVYLPLEVFTADYYTEINVTITGNHQVYTEAFTEAMEAMARQIEGDVTLIAQDRMVQLKADGEKEYADGLKEYTDGLAEFEKGKQEALDKLADGLKELEDGQAQWDENWQTVLDGEAQIAEGEQTLKDSQTQLADGKLQLAQSKAEAYAQLAQAHAELTKNYKDVLNGLEQVNGGLAQVEAGIPQIEDGLQQLEDGLEQLELVMGIQKTAVALTQNLLDIAKSSSVVDEERVAQLEDLLASQQAKYDEYDLRRQELLKTRDDLNAQLEELKKTRSELTATKATLEDAKKQIDLGFVELDSQQKQAENQFAAAEAELEAGLLQLETGKQELLTKKQELADGKAALEEAKAELDQGWVDYEDGKQKAEAELANAEAELQDAKVKLDDARKTLDEMKAAEVYILDRNTNQGYLAVDNNSDIVSGVSRVFPAFFLLVAALVCITTMTRMVDEERTQIGILKALGYSNRRIINKYLTYTGFAAVLGCGLGTVIGSVVFPIILWEAYGIILSVTPHIVLKMNWPLCLIVVGAYTAVSMLVTWYCCRRELREVPAELIRPKAPVAGKKIWMEYLPFWNKISFLNKVMFRNVFRYRQRFLMMLVGICGCTALLLTGFGLRDSILNIVDDQFENIMVYDLEVYFSEGQTKEQQTAFRESVKEETAHLHFFHQSNVELEFDKQLSDVFMIVSDDGISDFLQFRRNGEELEMPGVGEVYISVGASENMDIQLGDTVTLRDSDMRTLSVKVAGIFENHVYNFAVLRPETVIQQWGEQPQIQMAFMQLQGDCDAHTVGAKISEMENVVNVSVGDDLRQQVTSMMDALDLVVITIVVCAGLLAVIVLYNLTNISITERIREIATIKVLGFNAKETAAYVFKENLFLTALGTVAGLGAGVLLLEFVMSQIKVNFVWMQACAKPLSYVWAVVLTGLSAIFVDFLLYFKLEKINMAEALKSVE